MPTSNQQPNPAAGTTLPAAVILTGTYPVFVEVTCDERAAEDSAEDPALACDWARCLPRRFGIL